jgi:hypothetical protein
MARKAVKTAEERHGGGLEDGESGRSPGASERATAVEARGHGKIVEGIATIVERIITLLLCREVRVLYKRFLEEALEYHRGARIPLLISLAIGT